MSTPRSATPVPGVRATAQRTAVSQLLNGADDFRTAQHIHDQLRRDGQSVGLTTVYRTLQSLAEAGEVDVLRTASGELAYRRCSAHHHHHLLCRGCGRTIEISGAEVERWADRIAAQHAFTHIDHTAEITGYCADCHP